MRIKLLLLTLILLSSLMALAQEAGGIKGTVVARGTRDMLDGAKLIINTPLQQVVYAERGVFEIANLPAGIWTMDVEFPDYTSVRLSVRVISGQLTDLNFITLAPDFNRESADAFLLEVDDDSGGNAQDMPVSLSASRDIFDNIAAHKLSAMRFRPRGYESSTSAIYLNGVYLSDAMSGFSPWSLWGGLNDATRNQEITGGLMYSDYGVGAINGTTNINATASQVRKGWRASVIHGSERYLFRGMLTYASGENEQGWSYAFSASTRQGGNFWEYATEYNAWAYYASVEKRFGAHRIALTALGSPTKRGVSSAATQEAYDLAGSNFYNPNWGFQGGQSSGNRRNARVRDNHEPVVVLNYTWNIDANSKLLAAVAFRFGRNGYSALDWYDAPDPRPDYPRYLPGYYSDPATPSNVDRVKAAYLTESWKSDWNTRQINWDKLYNVNYNSYFDSTIGLEGVDASTRRSKYVIEERRADQRDLNAKLQWNTVLNKNMRLSLGADYRWNRTEYFKVMKDLLGGDAWLNIDSFAERDFGNNDLIQNDMNNPNRIIKEGDKYGYDYYGHLRNERFWTQFRYNYSEWEAYAAFERGYTQMWREGLYRKGLFPDNSFGDSQKQNFWTYTLKLGASYRISSAHRLWANFGYLTEAPYFQFAMVSPRTRNDFLPGLTTTKTLSADLNYALRLPFMNARLTGYYTTIKDQTKVLTFYDDFQRSFGNFAMRGIDELHTGLELGVEVPIVYGITFKGALSYGYFIYTSNPLVTQTIDNSSEVYMTDERVYWDKFKISGTPQTAASAGLEYRTRSNIWMGVDLSYYNANYISMSPVRRTDAALVGMVTPDRKLHDEIKAMRHQEMFDPAFVLNVNIGKLWYFGGRQLGVIFDVKNILNTTDIKTGGFEQLRVSLNRDANRYRPYDSKYYYMFGATYSLNVFLRF